MLSPKTPGVYIEEISKLPASIAPVATAIPAFIGYTENVTTDEGEDLTNKPTRIMSFLDYIELFGGPFEESLKVTLTNSSSNPDNTKISVATSSPSPYTLYHHLQMYFQNGGGPCYIVSVGSYVSSPSASDIDATKLSAGLLAVEQEDEVTLLVIPEAISLEAAIRKSLYDTMLVQCNKLQDRFSIFDVTIEEDTVFKDGNEFRNNFIGSDNLKYGAAYYPSLITGLNYTTKDEKVQIVDGRLIEQYNASATLETVLNGEVASAEISPDPAFGTFKIESNSKIAGATFTVSSGGTDFSVTEGTEFDIKGNRTETAKDLKKALNIISDGSFSASSSGTTVTIEASTPGVGGNVIGLKYVESPSVVLANPTLSGGGDAVAASGTIEITDISSITGTFSVGGKSVVVGTDFNIGTDNISTAAALAVALSDPNVAFSADNNNSQIVTITANDAGAAGNSIGLTYAGNGAILSGNSLTGGVDGVSANGTFEIVDISRIDGDTLSVGNFSLKAGSDFTKGTTIEKTAKVIAEEFNKLKGASAVFTATHSGGTVTITAAVTGTVGDSIALAYTNISQSVTLSGEFLTGGKDVTVENKALYNKIQLEIKKLFVQLYPSATMAGIYARVDNDRGVWKAPANVGVNLVRKPVIPVTHEEQGNLNVDATSGKSINAIRSFSGKGVLVWGSRTLAGNDNEWRYVPVRRFYIFVEESVKKATEFVVFEPNDAKTWVRVKTMIENFLTSLWKQGALAGAKPEHAFFVKVGLGETMTYQDILNGIMNIEIGMAAVRPAEFIILKFSHKIVKA